MAQDKRIFTGGMDKDSEPRLIKQGDYRDALNIRNIASSDGTSGSVENIEGNRVVPYTFTEEESNVVAIIDEGISDPVPNSEVILEQRIIFSGRELEDNKHELIAFSYTDGADLIPVFSLDWVGNSDRTASAQALYAAFSEGGYLSTGITIIDRNTGALGTAHSKVDFTIDRPLNGNNLTVTIVADEANFDFELDFRSPYSPEFNQLWSSTVNEEYFGAAGHLNITTTGAAYLGSELNFQQPLNDADIFTGEPLPPISNDVTQLLFAIEGQEPTSGQTFDSDIGGNLNVYSFMERADGDFDVLPFFTLAGGLFDSGASYEFDAQQDSLSEALTDKFTDFSAPVLVAGKDRPVLLRSFISSFGYGRRLQGNNSSVIGEGENANPDDFSLVKTYIDLNDTGKSRLGPGATIANGIVTFKGVNVQSGKPYNFAANIQKGESYIISLNTTNIDSGLDFHIEVGESTSPAIISTGESTFQFVAKSTVSHFSIVPNGTFGVSDVVSFKTLTLSTLLAPASSLKTVIQGGTSFAFNLCFGVSEEAVRQHLNEGNPPTTYINLIDGKLAAKVLPYNVSLLDFNDGAPTSEELLFTIQELEGEIDGLTSQLHDLIAAHESELETIQAYVGADSATADSIIDAIEANLIAYEDSAFNINEVAAALNAEVGAALNAVELVSNGDFSLNLNDWSFTDWAEVVDGDNIYVGTDIDKATLSQTLNVTPNQAYNYSIYVTRVSGALSLSLGDVSITINSSGTHTGTITPTSGDELKLKSVKFVGNVDNVSIQLVSIDTLTPAQLIGIYDTHIGNLNGALSLMSALTVELEDAGVVNATLQAEVNTATDEISSLSAEILLLDAEIADYSQNWASPSDYNDALAAHTDLVAAIETANTDLRTAIVSSTADSASIGIAFAAYEDQLTTAGIAATNIIVSLNSLKNSLETALEEKSILEADLDTANAEVADLEAQLAEAISQEDIDYVQGELDVANTRVADLEAQLEAALANQEDGVSQADVDAVQAELDAANAAIEGLDDAVSSLGLPDGVEMLTTTTEVDGIAMGTDVGDFGWADNHEITTTSNGWKLSMATSGTWSWEVKGGELEFNKSSGGWDERGISTEGFTGVATPPLAAGNYILSAYFSSDSTIGSTHLKVFRGDDTLIDHITFAASDEGREYLSFTVTEEDAISINEHGYFIQISTYTSHLVIDDVSLFKVETGFDASTFSDQDIFDLIDGVGTIPNVIELDSLTTIAALGESNDNLSADMISLIGLVSDISSIFHDVSMQTTPSVLVDLELQSTTNDTISFTSEYNEQTSLLSSLISTLNGTIAALQTQIPTMGIGGAAGYFLANHQLPYDEANGWIYTGDIVQGVSSVTWAAGGFAENHRINATGMLTYPDLDFIEGETYTFGPVRFYSESANLKIDTGDGTNYTGLNVSSGWTTMHHTFTAEASSDRIRIYHFGGAEIQLRGRDTPSDKPMLTQGTSA